MHTTLARRLMAAAVVVPLLLLGVAACSDDEPAETSTDTQSPIDEPTATPTDEPTATPTPGETEAPESDVVDDPAAIFDSMQQAMKDAGTALISMDAGMGTATGAMDYSGDEPSMSMLTDLGGFSIEMRYVDGELFVNMPPAPEGKFYKLGKGDALGLGDTLKGSSPSDSAAEIAEALEALVLVGDEDIAGEAPLVLVGDEDIAGEATTHYVATIDTERASLLSGGTSGLAEGIDLPEALDVDLWITQDSLLRRLVMGLGAVNIQLDYTAWGEPVDIRAPAAADILPTPKGLGP